VGKAEGKRTIGINEAYMGGWDQNGSQGNWLEV
jgi:hypothetical protein